MRFEAHQRPNESRLQPFRDEIAEMRSLEWPYQKISAWLDSERDLAISGESVRQFCIRREIPTGQKSSTRPRQTPPQRRKSAKLFEYDDSKPIETRRNR